MCNGVACSKATGLTYCNVEWVNACAILPKTRLTLSGFSPLQALTRSLHFPHPAKGASPPGRSVVDGSCRDERTRDIPQSLPRSLVSSAKPTTGIQVVRAFRPRCLNSLTPDAHRAGPRHPIAGESASAALYLLSCLTGGRNCGHRNTRARGSPSSYRSASQEQFAHQKRRDAPTHDIAISKMRYNGSVCR